MKSERFLELTLLMMMLAVPVGVASVGPAAISAYENVSNLVAPTSSNLEEV